VLQPFNGIASVRGVRAGRSGVAGPGRSLVDGFRGDDVVVSDARWSS
jgi:hypothetical protein